MRGLVAAPFVPARALRTGLAVSAAAAVAWCLWPSGPGVGVAAGAAGAAGTADAAAVCAAHGWRPFASDGGGGGRRRRPRRVYDLCMVNDELDWLEIRLNTTYAAVDYFVIVEGARTFTGLDKPLTIRDHWARFAPYHAKMLYHALQYPPGFDPPRAWDREDLQRNAMLLQALAPQPPGTSAAAGAAAAAAASDVHTPAAIPPAALPDAGDVLVVADVDEVPRPATLRALRLCRFPRRLTLASRFYYYSFQFRHRGPDWPHPQATFYDGPDGTVLPVHLRNGDGGRGGRGGSGSGWWKALLAPVQRYLDAATLPDAGWHCSSCYATMGELMHKLESVSHVWMNHVFFHDRDRAAHHVRAGIDLWDRAGETYARIDNNTDVPPLLLAEPARFAYLLSRDGPSAGFRDYP